ncbi:MAG: hypothetical protein HY569_01310 [Candidatus Magasanikbacteria bacterium]|nr:hypothetical protein [Candidatus Magasanikbacteria bacterium]
MPEGMARRNFLKKTGAILGLAILERLGIGGANAEPKTDAAADSREKEKYQLPEIEYQDKQLDGFVYQKSHDRTGKLKADSPENGKIIFFKESLSGKNNTVLRKLDHELHHQNFDKAAVEKQTEIARLVLSRYKIEGIFKYVLNEPIYEAQFEQLQKQYGQQAAEIYVVNEFLGHIMSYADYPPPEVKSPKEHFTEQQWKEFLAEEIKNGGTEKTLIEQFKQNPGLITPASSVAYDVSDKFFFELQKNNMLLPDELKKALEKYDLTPNTERAKVLLEKIKKLQ